jgi:ABC-type multidrug transport system fused ATPase/permease subunit
VADIQRIVEYGSHDELMELKGKYFECFDLQRKGFQ